ncbi:MAG: hypothetical protein COU69_01475 [Candidatus Pacebacteria bacterium CG10_big_fil_rev_8_21_14_0_10_56_10]|nr:MAG: hypothetical protein COU69_01475 [Candidatus Pacebacteria bacterium CG10_big_fil_rev_8_21_14_0_10_56_10]
MPSPKPAAPRARPGGGLNSHAGAAPHEHLDEAALREAVNHKQHQQQSSASTPGQTAKSQQDSHQQSSSRPHQPRSVGTLRQELVGRPLADIGRDLKSLIDINTLLGISYQDPRLQAKQHQLHQRWQQLTQDEQDYSRRLYQQKVERQRQDEQRQEEKEQAEQADAQQPVVAPSSQPKGPVGLIGLSRREQATTRIAQQRQTLGGLRGSS